MRWFKYGLLSAVCGLSLSGTQLTAQTPREGDRPAGQPGDRGPGDRGPGDRGPGDRGQGDRGRGQGDRGPGGMRMMFSRLPIMAALDADNNGEISASEIETAAVALKKLDKNGDGKLTMDELMPEGGGPGSFGGPGGFGGGPGGFGGGVGGPGGFGVDPIEVANRMMEADKNKDGFVDKDEAPERMQPMFARADTDKDGKLSKDEITKAAALMGRRGGEGGQRPGGEGGQRPGGEGGQRPQRPTSDK